MIPRLRTLLPCGKSKFNGKFNKTFLLITPTHRRSRNTVEAWLENDTQSDSILHGTQRYRDQRPIDGPYPAARVTFADHTHEKSLHNIYGNEILSTKAAKNPYLAASLRRWVFVCFCGVDNSAPTQSYLFNSPVQLQGSLWTPSLKQITHFSSKLCARDAFLKPFVISTLGIA